MSDQKKITEKIAEYLSLQAADLDPDAHLIDDLGLNLAEISDLLDHLSQNFGIIFDSAEVSQVKTVGDLVDLTEDKLLE
ncbi:MAG: acyl carrier protein [Candidatus Daviesbacteria bacterium]|nr:acyl carrier protein [Candidatus Daviesbacteria bacterium]